MNELSNLTYAEGSRKKCKRVGRGPGSGHGKTSCRGENGQKSRAGSTKKLWFEGGQMPLQRRVPKFGFTNYGRQEYIAVNLATLSTVADKVKIEGGKITPEVLYDCGVLSKKTVKFKVLGQGEFNQKLTVEAHAFSKSAQEKIEAAGGKTIIVK